MTPEDQNAAPSRRLSVLVPALPGRAYTEGDSLDLSVPIVWTMDDVLAGSECADLIRRIDSLGPTAAPITTAFGFEMRPDIRNNQRVIFDDPALAGDLFRRVRATLPSRMFGDYEPVGANERFRCYRYQVGHRFAPHFDGAFIRDDRETSLLTFMVYLNDGYEGGTTNFYSFSKDIIATPQRGRALLFQHHLLHEGAEVTKGVKYVLRSDVMYRTGVKAPADIL